MGVGNLPRVVAWWCAGRESNPRPLDHESDTLTTTPPSNWSNFHQNKPNLLTFSFWTRIWSLIATHLVVVVFVVLLLVLRLLQPDLPGTCCAVWCAGQTNAVLSELFSFHWMISNVQWQRIPDFWSSSVETASTIEALLWGAGDMKIIVAGRTHVLHFCLFTNLY